VISDWNMEPMTGYELLRHVRADDALRTTPFIIGHRLHVPVGDHEAVLLLLQLRQRAGAVRGVVDILDGDASRPRTEP
jgi:CheY-like chemotaxis protein